MFPRKCFPSCHVDRDEVLKPCETRDQIMSVFETTTLHLKPTCVCLADHNKDVSALHDAVEFSIQAAMDLSVVSSIQYGLIFRGWNPTCIIKLLS